VATLDSGWHSVRCVFQASQDTPSGPDDLGPGESAYEERVTLWQTDSADRAIELAENEARHYASENGVEYLGMAQSYRLAVEPAEGAEVFSLIRKSDLEPGAYLDAFFDTGTEYQDSDADE
jgi:hypothetical protein